MDTAAVVGYVVGALLGALLLYVVIRLAVTHAILATRPKPSRPATVPPPAKTWFN